MPKTEWSMLLMATVIATVITVAAVVIAAVVIAAVVQRIIPHLGRGGRFLAGVFAAVEMNWRHASRFLSERAAVAEQWAAEQRRLRDDTRRRAFLVATVSPSSNDGQATWYRVTGVQRDTEQDVDLVTEAKTPANASAKAELRGLVVTSVEPIQPPQPVAPL